VIESPSLGITKWRGVYNRGVIVREWLILLGFVECNRGGIVKGVRDDVGSEKRKVREATLGGSVAVGVLKKNRMRMLRLGCGEIILRAMELDNVKKAEVSQEDFAGCGWLVMWIIAAILGVVIASAVESHL